LKIFTAAKLSVLQAPKNLRFFECKKFEIRSWYNWAKQNSPLFAGLVNGSIVAISMTGNDERMILLEKENGDLKVNITNLKELENQAADLMFLMNEKDMGKLLEDDNSAKFIELLPSGKVQIYALISQSQLIDKGYNAFLDKLGFRLGCSGGCC
jgi:epoxyqueuosine reductase